LLAAFTEPITTPGNSVQDWAKNIMGANSADNEFDSSSVTANSDGSIVERLEDLGNYEYVTCVNVYQSNGTDSSFRPVCPTNFISISDGFWMTHYGYYTSFRACCLPR